VARLPKTCPFEFVVLGDTHNTSVAETLMWRIKREEPDFIILLGDFVEAPELARNRFFWGMIERSGLTCPIFLVIGDDDVVPRASDCPSKEAIAQYEVWYGPRNFSFYARDCLFILLFNIREDKSGGYLDFLEKTLKERKPGTRHTFVCAHVPPHFSLPEAPPEILEADPRFFKLLEEYGVDYTLAGHEHGYWRGNRKGVEYVKLAGGGGRLPEKDGWGMFHHAMRFRVGEDLLAEDIMTTQRARNPIHALRHFCWIHAYPFWSSFFGFFFAAVLAPGALLILLIIGGIWSKVKTGTRARQESIC